MVDSNLHDPSALPEWLVAVRVAVSCRASGLMKSGIPSKRGEVTTDYTAQILEEWYFHRMPRAAL
jgi:hypothetical protein